VAVGSQRSCPLKMDAQIFTVGEKREAEEQCSGAGPAVRTVRPGHWAPALGFRASCPDSRPSPTHLVFTRSCKVLEKLIGKNSYCIWREPYIITRKI